MGEGVPYTRAMKIEHPASRWNRRAAVLALALLLLPSVAPLRAAEAAKVVWVTDGDTITVRIGPRKEKVRLLGIDTPELKDERKAWRDLAWDARDYARQSLKGRIVTLEPDRLDRDRDDYRRLLRYVVLGDGTNFNLELVRKGYARVYRKFDFTLKPRFLAAEEEAKKRKLGVWALPPRPARAMGGGVPRPSRR